MSLLFIRTDQRLLLLAERVITEQLHTEPYYHLSMRVYSSLLQSLLILKLAQTSVADFIVDLFNLLCPFSPIKMV